MAKKAFCLSLKDKERDFGSASTTPKFTNLNFNKTHHESVDNLLIPPKTSLSAHQSNHGYVSDLKNDLQTKRNSNSKVQWNKTLHSIPFEYFKIQNSEEGKKKLKNNSTTKNSSTLSLHISAYENHHIETFNNSNIEIKTTERIGCGKSLKDFVLHGLKSNFEIPRQQKGVESTEPEAMQFKASQKLLNPNEQKSLAKCETEKDAPESTFENLKEKANNLFKDEKYKEAIEIYDEILQLPDLSPSNKSIIYSNKSATNLMLKNLKNAKADAEEAIKVMPNWWKGYFRLGRAQMGFEEWKDAEKSLEKALALNPKSKESRDELSTVRIQIGIIKREAHLDPAYQRSISIDAQMAHACNRFGLTEDQIKDILKKTTEKDPIAAYLIEGEKYKEGYGVEKDLSKAVEYYEKAAALGCSFAMYNLGVIFHYGNGIKRDFEKSRYWFLKAANSPLSNTRVTGVAEAQHAIGLNYEDGLGVEKDYRKAAEWYEKSAKNGSDRAACNLGALYRHGNGVELSPAKAFHYFKVSAAKGNTTAMMNLADVYLNQFNFAEAKKWLKAAVENGDTRAAEKLARLSNSDKEN